MFLSELPLTCQYLVSNEVPQTEHIVTDLVTSKPERERERHMKTNYYLWLWDAAIHAAQNCIHIFVTIRSCSLMFTLLSTITNRFHSAFPFPRNVPAIEYVFNYFPYAYELYVLKLNRLMLFSVHVFNFSSFLYIISLSPMEFAT